MPRKMIACFFVGASLTVARADEPAGSEQPPLKPTSIGVRFTPEMARAMGRNFSKQMKSRYELSDESTAAIAEIIARRAGEFAARNQEAARDVIEFTIAATISEDGEFTRETAKRFAPLAQKLVPALKQITIDATNDIKKEMSLKQQLKFTGDLAAFTAGVVAFDARMDRWKEGKIAERPNPFWEESNADEAASQPAATREQREFLEARGNARRVVEWNTKQRVDRWKNYVDHAAAYYQFNTAQLNAATSILKECQDRARRFQTPEGQQELEQVLLIQNLSYQISDELICEGPWMSDVQDRYTHLTKALTDLDAEFKLRIRELAFAEQIAAAEKSVYEKLEKKGYRKPANR